MIRYNYVTENINFSLIYEFISLLNVNGLTKKRQMGAPFAFFSERR